MKQIPPVFGKTFDVAEISRVLNLRTSDFDKEHPVQEVSTGVPFIIVPLKTLDAVKRARIDRDKNISNWQRKHK